MNTYNFSNRWDRIKKLLALVTAVLLWIVSIIFSYKGFNLSTADMAWVGIVMAFAVTVLELILNTNKVGDLIDESRNVGEWLLVAGGCLAYVYDIWTNILGIYAVQGRTPTADWSIIVPFLVGVFMAVLPEPMFVWSMGMKKSATVAKPIYNKQFKPYKGNQHNFSNVGEYLRNNRNEL